MDLCRRRLACGLRELFFTFCLLSALVSTELRAEDWLYKVRSGDNLWNLAERYLLEVSYWRKLQTYNAVADPWHIPPGTIINIPSHWLKQLPILARVRTLEGEAELIEEDSGNTTPLTSGALVVMGDAIRTGRNSNLTLELMDGSRLLLLPDSYLTLNRLSQFKNTEMTDTRLHLHKGRMEIQVAPKKGEAGRFQLITPTAVTSVRGTDYRLSSDDKLALSRAEVLGGRVDVASGGSTQSIPKGFGTIAKADVPPQPPIKLLDSPDLSPLNRTFERVPLQFQLKPLSQAKGYRVQIAADNQFERLLFDQQVPAEFVRGPDLPDGEYRLRVRGVDAQGLEGMNADLHFVLNARPEPPFPLEPKPGAAVPEETPQFDWSRQDGGRSYHFQIASDIGFAKPILDVTGLSDAHLKIEKPLRLGNYFWRVASADATEGEGPFSDPQAFRRIPPAPNVESTEMDDERIVIRWRTGLPGQRYQFQFADNQSFDKPLVDQQTPDPQLQIARPDSGEYFMRVRTIDPDGFIGPFGQPQAVDVPRKIGYWWLLALPLFALIAI